MGILLLIVMNDICFIHMSSKGVLLHYLPFCTINKLNESIFKEKEYLKDFHM